MSDTSPKTAPVELPPDDVMEDAAPSKARRGMSPAKKVLMASGVAIVAMGSLIFMSSAPPAPDSTIRKPPTLDATPGGQNQAESQVYQDSVREYNESRARQAADLGLTSLPVPESILSDFQPVKGVEEVEIRVEEVKPAEEPKQAPKVVERRILPRPEPAPASAVPAYAPKPQDAPVQVASGSGKNGNGEEQENPYKGSISSMMQGTVQHFTPKGMQEFAISQPQERDQNASSAAPGANPGDNTGTTSCENCATSANSGAPDYSAENILMRPGDLLYAETLTSVNSDTPSAVMVEVVAGEHKGARMVGGFTADRASGRMLVEFDSMTFADGRVYDLAAVAVDGRTAETAVRSDIERRYVARYAPILASTFIESYAGAMAGSRQTVIGTGDSTQVVTEPATERESILAGVAGAAGAIAEDIAQSAPKGPKIILQAGWPLAIMITEPVLIDTPARERPEQAQAAPAQAGSNVVYPVRVN